MRGITNVTTHGVRYCGHAMTERVAAGDRIRCTEYRRTFDGGTVAHVTLGTVVGFEVCGPDLVVVWDGAAQRFMVPAAAPNVHVKVLPAALAAEAVA